jgi:aminoglycoside 2''-phosphotransferase
LAFDLPRPDNETIRLALARTHPNLARLPIEPLGTGWAFWAYRAGDAVLRFPKDPEFTRTLGVEAAVMRELASTLPLPVAVIEVHADGPHGLPFTSHRFVPGVSVKDLQRPLAPDAGAVLGRFMRAMHAFPVERAVELGIAYEAPEGRRKKRRRILNEEIVPRVFPVISATAREHVIATFEAYLRDDPNFDYTPVVSHGDLDDWNVLADPETGELSGVADWGDITISDPAGDFTVSLYGGFGKRGISVPDLIHAYGISKAELDKMRPRCRFSAYCWPLWEVLYGLDTRDDAAVKRGIEFLYETIDADGTRA